MRVLSGAEAPADRAIAESPAAWRAYIRAHNAARGLPRDRRAASCYELLDMWLVPRTRGVTPFDVFADGGDGARVGEWDS